MKCPLCGRRNQENWPLRMPDETIREGGCQDCWERQADEEWWKVVSAMAMPPGPVYPDAAGSGMTESAPAAGTRALEEVLA